MANIHKSSIQARHHLSDLANKNIAYGEVVIRFLVMEFGKFAVLNKCEFNALFGRVDD
jgi:hypothetical protein